MRPNPKIEWSAPLPQASNTMQAWMSLANLANDALVAADDKTMGSIRFHSLNVTLEGEEEEPTLRIWFNGTLSDMNRMRRIDDRFHGLNPAERDRSGKPRSLHQGMKLDDTPKEIMTEEVKMVPTTVESSSPATDAARKYAEKKGVNIADIPSPGRTINRFDVVNYLKGQADK